MRLAFDTSSAACTAALFDGSGECIARADEIIGRGHAERLVPMIAELMDGRSATQILVGVGPGSFTGIRVAIAAAHGLAIGWGAELEGMSSLALLAELAPDVIEIESVVTPGRRESRRQLPVTHPREHGGAADAQLPRYLTRGQQPHAATVVGTGQRC